jgi:hypothetical protein
MRLEVFEAIITKIKSQADKSFDLLQMGIDLMNYEDDYSAIISLFFKAYYGEEGDDWISWFLYDRESFTKGGEPNQAWDKDGNEICYDIPSLWKTVEELRCSTDFVEYELPKPKADPSDLMSTMFGNVFKK